MAYYSPGDDVTYIPKGCDAKILKSLPGDEYVVEFEDRTLIPPQMQVPGHYLKPRMPIFNPFGLAGILGDDLGELPRGVKIIDKHTNCPRCGDAWKETWIGHRPFYDCLKCNLKKEDA